jgi:hypothetical protein
MTPLWLLLSLATIVKAYYLCPTSWENRVYIVQTQEGDLPLFFANSTWACGLFGLAPANLTLDQLYPVAYYLQTACVDGNPTWLYNVQGLPLVQDSCWLLSSNQSLYLQANPYVCGNQNQTAVMCQVSDAPVAEATVSVTVTRTKIRHLKTTVIQASLIKTTTTAFVVSLSTSTDPATTTITASCPSICHEPPCRGRNNDDGCCRQWCCRSDRDDHNSQPDYAGKESCDCPRYDCNGRRGERKLIRQTTMQASANSTQAPQPTPAIQPSSPTAAPSIVGPRRSLSHRLLGVQRKGTRLEKQISRERAGVAKEKSGKINDSHQSPAWRQLAKSSNAPVQTMCSSFYANYIVIQATMSNDTAQNNCQAAGYHAANVTVGTWSGVLQLLEECQVGNILVSIGGYQNLTVAWQDGPYCLGLQYGALDFWYYNGTQTPCPTSDYALCQGDPLYIDDAVVPTGPFTTISVTRTTTAATVTTKSTHWKTLTRYVQVTVTSTRSLYYPETTTTTSTSTSVVPCPSIGCLQF